MTKGIPHGEDIVAWEAKNQVVRGEILNKGIGSIPEAPVSNYGGGGGLKAKLLVMGKMGFQEWI